MSSAGAVVGAPTDGSETHSNASAAVPAMPAAAPAAAAESKASSSAAAPTPAPAKGGDGGDGGGGGGGEKSKTRQPQQETFKKQKSRARVMQRGHSVINFNRMYKSSGDMCVSVRGLLGEWLVGWLVGVCVLCVQGIVCMSCIITCAVLHVHANIRRTR